MNSRCFRNSVQSQNRKLNRSLNRYHLRLLPGGRRINYLQQGISALGKAIRAHRRLMKLAPSLFDFGILDREAAQYKEQKEWMALWEPYLEKVYAGALDETAPCAENERCNKSAKKVQNGSAGNGGLDDDYWQFKIPKSPEILAAMEHEYQQWQLGMASARENLQLHEKLRPHAVMSLTSVARLLDAGTTLRRLATGLETNDREPPFVPDDHRQVWADLKRAYGDEKPP